MLDRAATGREIGILVALTLMEAGGETEEALAILNSLRGVAQPQEHGELDAVPIAEQAIREASALRTGTPA